ncbi:MAG: sn-glycerol-3-phosphate ABC transporter permease UgpA [Alphaproteobacteria bacterium]|nr:sn-glycerol-3-phosphate ABC transporter permease UgpA [Alphaproteobacteria bacterium]TAD90535.1 MAG: sn-glycerol-3-phosphate ABC transporter permease UgpA [Alphaproteobacteria bacterium]
MQRKVIFKGTLLPILLIAPQLAITGVFFFWPAGQALYFSVLEQDMFGTSYQYVGLENFRTVLSDPGYVSSLWTTAVFSVGVTALALVPSLYLAVQVDRVMRGKGLYQTLIVLPYAIAPAVAGVLWLFLFNPTVGSAAWVLRQLGVAWNPILNGDHAMILVVIASAWKQISYNFLFFLAGLQSIPRSVIEAAAIDGASRQRQFWDIIFPLLSPTTFFLIVVNVVYAFFDTFGVIDAVTSGGPAKATEILVYKVYNDGFRSAQFGTSAAQSVILMAIVIALTAIQFRYIERKVHY